MPNNKSGGGAIDDGPGPAASTTAVSPVSRMIDMLRRFFPMDEPVPLALGAGAPGRVVLAAGASEAARPPLHDLHAHILVDERARRMVSEVFVDILAALLLRAAEGAGLEVEKRRRIRELPGFDAIPGLKASRRSDLCLFDRRTARRTLVAARWSLLGAEQGKLRKTVLECVGPAQGRRGFGFVLVTAELETRRLAQACAARAGDDPLFDRVVHVDLAALPDTRREATQTLAAHRSLGRLVNLGAWLDEQGAR